MASETVLNLSSLSYDSALDIFSVPASNLGIKEVKYLEHRPRNTFNSESTIRFSVTGGGKEYFYLPETRLKIKLRILNHDGTPIDPVLEEELAAPEENGGSEKEDSDAVDATKDKKKRSYVSVINNFCNSMFEQVEVSLNDTVVSSGTTGFAHKSLINTLLDSSDSVKKTRLQTSMFYRDTPGGMDSCDVTFFGLNEGLKKRHRFFNGSKPVEMIAKLDVDVFKLDRYLLNGIRVGLILHSTSMPFRLMCPLDDPSFKIEIMDICLVMCHVQPSGPVLVAHQDLMKNENRLARYDYIKEEVRKFSISHGHTSFECTDMFQDRCPDRLVFVLCSSASVSGSYRLNPFNFHHHNLVSIDFKVHGERIPCGELKMDFDRGHYTQAYEALFTATKPRYIADSSHSTCGISYDDFGKGYAIFAVDLNPSTRSGNFYPTKQQGEVSIALQFSKPLKETVLLLCVTYSPAYFEIDYLRGVYLGKSGI